MRRTIRTSLRFRSSLALAAACISFAIAPAAAQPVVLPPDKAYVPGDEKAFGEGTVAFDAGDYAKAFAIFSKLADNDDLAARRNVALMQRKGLGTEKDPKAALENYRIAAQAGLPTAAADLGEMLLDGEAGPRDAEAALPWLEIASRSGHAIAEFHLGELYEKGEAVPQDIARAKLLYEAAAARGVKEAGERLSHLNELPEPKSDAPPVKLRGSEAPP